MKIHGFNAIIKINNKLGGIIFMSYDYKKGKQSIINILNSDIDVEESDKIPMADAVWTYANGIRAWVGAIFIDLRNSTEFFKKSNPIIVAKVIRAYTSEVIQIMNMTTLNREIGIRGDAVYGIYSVSKQQQVNEVFNIACYLNTQMKMLNKLLTKKGYAAIKAGIGYAISKDLIIKSGKKGTGINDRVWIGESLSKADELSKITNKGTKPIAISSSVYSNLSEENKRLFTFNQSKQAHYADVVISDFNKWIDGGMKI